MGFALFLLFAFLLPDWLWWRWADRRVRGRPWARGLVALFALAMAGFIGWMVLFRRSALDAHHHVPKLWLDSVYLWHILVLPLTLLALLPLRLLRRRPATGDRRAFLRAMAAPAVTAAAAALAPRTLADFRVRRFDLAIPSLPPALDGLRLAHLSDLHFGKYTDPAQLERVLEALHGMDADLALFTGDLVDLSLKDLDMALAFLRRIRTPLWLCEGNHDLIDDGAAFRARVRDAGFNLLLDEAATVAVRGGAVRLLGAAWRGDASGRRQSMDYLRSLLEPGAFPIVLAHHPHSFDDGVGFPLMLSGHTHGGLLMLNERLGAGPVLYRYWSGDYREGDRFLVVSNGIGHWFPLRLRAPAEIARITLRPAG